MSYNKQKALAANVAALELAYDVSLSPRVLTEEERAVLSAYSGFGGLKAAMSLRDVMEGDPRAAEVVEPELMADMERLADWVRRVGAADGECRELADAIGASVLTAFYTPEAVTRAVADATHHTLRALGLQGATMLDPACGAGAFLAVGAGMRRVAVEIDRPTAMVLSALHPDVEVHCKGFEALTEADTDGERFDVIATNVPFGEFRVSDAQFARCDRRREFLSTIHGYFCAKAIDWLTDGGVAALLVPRGISDTASHTALRNYLTERARLLSAVRLPDTLFLDGSGIEVGSDLLILQRDDHRGRLTELEAQWCELKERHEDGNAYTANRLLSQPDRALYTRRSVRLDRYGRQYIVRYAWGDSDDALRTELTRRLSSDMERRASSSAWVHGHDYLHRQIEEREAADREAQSCAEMEERERREQQMKEAYEPLRDAYFALRTAERTERRERSDLRQELNMAYDMWRAQFGTLHDHERAVRRLPDGAVMLALECRAANGDYNKADIFSTPIDFRPMADGSFSPREALAVCLSEHGAVEPAVIARLTGQSWGELLDELRGEVFFTIERRWAHRSAVIRGNVVAAAREYAAVIESSTDAADAALWQHTHDALVAATPAPIPFDDIDIQLGTRWVPTRFFSAFARRLFNTSDAFAIEYSTASDTFAIQEPYYCAEAGSHGELAVRADNKTYTGCDIFRFAMADHCPDVWKEVRNNDGELVKAKDEDTMRRIQQNMDKVRERFVDFIKGTALSDAERNELAALYNERFNCYVRPDYDGSHQTFPGLDLAGLGIQDLYQSQKDAIWMLKQQMGGVCWHEVGAGKTLIMCVTAYEMHRLGICNKPLIIGLKANVAQIADTFRKAYPSARLLYPGKEDFTQAKRKDLFEKIANNDWDCIILTHDQFARIPQSPEAERVVLQTKLEELESNEDFLRHSRIGGKEWRRIQRDINRRRKTLDVALADAIRRIKEHEDEVLNFREMGIDHIFVDEYHQFKNLMELTRHSRVAGLGNTQGSQRAHLLLTAIRDIQQRRGGKDLGATFLSGTIVTNALTELYVLFDYLRPSELKRQGIYCFDAWLSQFVWKNTDYELTITGAVRSKERFRKYLNVPELAQFLREITDYRTAEMMSLDVPDKNVIFDESEPTEQQKEMLCRLIAFAESGQWSTLGLDTCEPQHLDKSKMLVATDVARKVSLDPRILSTDLFSDDPDNKASRCASKVIDYYQRFHANRGVQFIFSDLSTYNKGGGWNIYEEIRSKLIDRGIPKAEIAFIGEHDTERRRAKLFDDLNSGRVRVVFGSTQKLGTGVNAQQRAVAVHHLDIPWRPADLEQRNGRAVRKGNEVKFWGGNQVDVIIYGTRRTLDAYKFGLLQNKAMFIKQICNGTIATRHIDEDSMTEDGGMSYAEYVAILSGNTTLLEKAKLDARIANLEKDKAQHLRDQRRTQSELDVARKSLSEAQCIVDKATADLAAVERMGSLALHIDAAKAQTPEEQGRAIQELRAGATPKDQTMSIGRLGHMEVTMRLEYAVEMGDATQTPKLQKTWLYVRVPDGLAYYVNDRGTLPGKLIDIPVLFDGLKKQIAALRDRRSTDVRRISQNIAQMETILATSWNQDEELIALRQQREDLDNSIHLGGKANPEKEAAPAVVVQSNAESKAAATVAALVAATEAHEESCRRATHAATTAEADATTDSTESKSTDDSPNDAMISSKATPIIFHKAAAAEANWERFMADSGCQRRTTFYADLTIAEEIGGVAGIGDTVKRSLDEWLTDIEFVTELYLCLNHKAWEWADRKDAGLLAERFKNCYIGMQQIVYERIHKHYEGDEEALSYFFHTTD